MNLEEAVVYGLEGLLYVECPRCLCESNSFGARIVFGVHAYRFFLQSVLAIISLIGGMLWWCWQVTLDAE